MSARYGNSGGRGRRITDWNDQPLTDGPIDGLVAKGLGKDAAKLALMPVLGAKVTGQATGRAARRLKESGRAVREKGANVRRTSVDKGLRADNDFDRHRRTRAGLAAAMGASSIPLFAPTRAGYLAGGVGVAGGATVMARNTPGKRRPKSEVGKWDKEDTRALRNGAAVGGGTQAAYDIGRSAHWGAQNAKLFGTTPGIAAAGGALGGAVATLPRSAIAAGVTGGVGLGVHRWRKKKRKEKAAVGKTARYYDPEGRRQRRLGVAEAALLGGGGALAYRGGRGIARTTKLIRGSKVVSEGGGEIVPKKLLTATRRDLAQAGGGAALVGAAGAVDYHGNHPRGRHWR